VLLHELAHLTRGDLRGRWLFALAMPLAWWNPLFWRLRRQAHVAAEMLADELAARWHHDRAGYARSLIDLAELLPRARHAQVAALGAFGPPTHFTQRMTMLLTRQSPLVTRSSRLASLARSTTVIALAALASLAWTAPRLVAQQEPATPIAPTQPAPAPGGASKSPKATPLRYQIQIVYAEEKDLGTVVTTLATRGFSIEKLEVVPASQGKRSAAVIVTTPHVDRLEGLAALLAPARVERCVPATPGGRSQPADRVPRVRFAFEKTDVRKVIDAIAKISGANVVVAPEVQGQVTLRIQDVPWREALDITARQVGAKVTEHDGGVLAVEKR
jgi:hypothetical protein